MPFELDAFSATLWFVRFAFVALLYLFFVFVARAMWRDLRTAAATSARPLGRLVVLASPEGQPPAGTSLPVDAVNTLGRDVNNSIVIDDTYASAQHAVLTFRGRAWYLEDAGSTNGTWVNGQRIGALTAVTFGDEIQIGQVRLRLERALPA